MAYDYDLDTFDDDEEPSGGRNTRLLLVLGGVVGLVVVVAVIAFVAVLLTRRNRSPSEGEIVVDVPTTEATEAPTFTPFPSEAPSATQTVVEAVTPETGGGGEATISPTPAPTRVAGSITNGSMSEIEGLVQLQIPNTDTWIDVADDV
ncbi:MAG: hypothetical protein ACE5FI_16925, partial [Anaerolineales bacterium]